jgi:hypothetical protein
MAAAAYSTSLAAGQVVPAPQLQSASGTRRLPTELTSVVCSFLDGQSLARLGRVNRDHKNFITPFFTNLKSLSIYDIFALAVPKELYGALKPAMKTALKVYTFLDPGSVARASGYIAGRYNLVKLSGTHRYIASQRTTTSNVRL